MVQAGSSLRLICLLRYSMDPPAYIFWYHDSKMINYDITRGVEVTHERFSSELVLPRAAGDDSGNYTCVPSNAQSASITVHIIKSKSDIIYILILNIPQILKRRLCAFPM